MPHNISNRNINDLERGKFTSHGEVRFQPGYASSDAFGKMRTGTPFGAFDSKQIGVADTGAWEILTVGAGSSSVYNFDSSSSILTVDAAANDRVVRQSRLYTPYVPGRSHLILATATLGEAVAGISKRIGYYDDNDGPYFEVEGDGTVNVVIRSSVSGTPVETKIPQFNSDGNHWNLDKLDGWGTSRKTLDISKSQIFVIDFAWLGVGTVRFGFIIDGVIHYVHAEDRSNVTSAVYMRTPSLPVRYEIYNVDGGDTASVEQICATVISEGGYENAGFEFTASNGIAKRTIAVRTPILAVRMGSLLGGEENRRVGQLLENAAYASGNDIYWELQHIHDPSSFTGTFSPASASHSGAEFSTDISAITAAVSHLVRAGYSGAGTGPRGSSANTAQSFKTRHTIFNRNLLNDNSHYLVLFATPMTGSADVSAQLTWVEFG